MAENFEDFLGFYDELGFWVEDYIDINCQAGRRRLSGIIPEPAVFYKSEKFSSIVCVDGLMLLHVNHLASSRPDMGNPDNMNEAVAWWDKHMDYANAMQLYIESESIRCPSSGEISFSAVSIANTCRVGIRNGIPVRKNHTNRMSLMAARCASLVVASTDETHHVTGTWSTFTKVTKQAIYTALQRFELAVNDPVFIRRLGFMARAKAAYKDNDFRGSFIMIWFVIESIVKEIWSNKIWVSGKKTKTVHEMLLEIERSAVLDMPLLSSLNDLRRRVRNDLVHQSDIAICMPSDCFQAADCATQLLGVSSAAMDLAFSWKFGVEY